MNLFGSECRTGQHQVKNVQSDIQASKNNYIAQFFLADIIRPSITTFRKKALLVAEDIS